MSTSATSHKVQLTRTMSDKKVVVTQPEVKFPIKKFRMRSLLWVKPSGNAVSTPSSFMAQLFPTLIVNLAALSAGLGYGYSAIALPQLKDYFGADDDVYQPFTINDDEGSWIAGMFGLGAIFGGFVSAFIGTLFGRRKSLLLLTFPDIVGWALIAGAQNLPMMLAGRFLTGFAAAGYTSSIQVYVAEIAQPQHRGTLTAVMIPSMATGTLLAYCLGSVISWHYVAVVAVAVPILLIPGLLLISNSPYWYLQQGEEKKAVQAMECFRSSDANGLSELLAIADIMKPSSDLQDEIPTGFGGRMKNTLGKLGHRQYRRPFLILNSLFLLMLFAGEYAISFYAVEIFRHASHGDSSIHEYLSAIIVGAIKLVGSLLFIPAIKYCTRRFLLGVSSIIMATSLGVLGLSMYAHNSTDLLSYPLPSWLPLLCVTIYMAADPIGLGSIPYIYTAELYPAEVRSVFSGITIGLSHLEMFTVVKTFPMLSVAIADGGVFWVYAGVCVAAAVFALLFVPETKGKSLEEIERHFGHKKTLHATPYATPAASRRNANRAHPMQSIQFTL